MKRSIIIPFLLLFLRSFSQSEVSIQSLQGINTSNDDIACGLIDGELVYITNGKQDLVNDYQWNKRNVFHLERAVRGKTLNEWTSNSPLFPFQSRSDEGPATYDAEDSVLYFSSANNYSRTRGSNLKIFKIKKYDTGWSTPEVLPFCDSQSDYAHPWYDASQRLLVFSSNRAGGQGLMDIWYSYKTETGWTEPANCGVMVNGLNNEIFPSVYNGDIYYSSNSGGGPGGYDIKRALRSQQWKSNVVLESPLNSPSDELCLFYLNDYKGMLSSNRSGGSGGDDVYVFEHLPLKDERHQYKALLRCEDLPRGNVQVTVTNGLREIVIDQKTDEAGYLNIEQMRLNQRYRLQLGGMDPSLYSKSVLQILDVQGNVIKELRFNAMGICDLELLPLNYADLNLRALEDGSLLTIQIEGQLYKEEPGDIGRGEPITILDDKGDPVAIAFTNETGKFRFTEVQPELNYRFKLAEESKAQNVLITEKGEKIVLPVLNAEVNYQRLNQDEAILLVNEFNETIYVSPKDVFVINRIYYEYNSAKLTSEAQTQLDQLALLMEKNKDIKLELRSHTDSRGKDEFNLTLSRKRAESAVAYLTGKKIAASRFTPIGLGETQLLNECDDGIECSEPEHTINRRTEIKITK